MSQKRILPAFLLAMSVGFLGLHRFYVGRPLTALVMLAIFIPGAFMLRRDMTGIENLQTFDQVMDWTQDHPMHPVPWALVGIPSLWALIDCYALLARKFRDGAGNPITRWV
jgi:hypothetical protein